MRGSTLREQKSAVIAEFGLGHILRSRAVCVMSLAIIIARGWLAPDIACASKVSSCRAFDGRLGSEELELG